MEGMLCVPAGLINTEIYPGCCVIVCFGGLVCFHAWISKGCDESVLKFNDEIIRPARNC